VHLKLKLSDDKIQPKHAFMPNFQHIYEILRMEMENATPLGPVHSE